MNLNAYSLNWIETFLREVRVFNVELNLQSPLLVKCSHLWIDSMTFNLKERTNPLKWRERVWREENPFNAQQSFGISASVRYSWPPKFTLRLFKEVNFRMLWHKWPNPTLVISWHLFLLIRIHLPKILKIFFLSFSKKGIGKLVFTMVSWDLVSGSYLLIEEQFPTFLKLHHS